MTKVVQLQECAPDRAALQEAGDILRRGGLVVFPTETVYGLGANALMEDAVASIYQAKGRPSDNPLIVHITSYAQIDQFAYPNQWAKLICDRFSPGPITVILKKKPLVPDRVTAGLDTVAVRIPQHPIARALIAAAGVPVAAPSANLSGKPSPTRAEHVVEDMDGRVDMILLGGDCSVGIESTVIDLSGSEPIILRPGKITLSQIKKIIPCATLDRTLLEKPSRDLQPKCPGMKYKHYAPDAQVIVYEGRLDCVAAQIKEDIRKYQAEEKKVGVLCRADSGYRCDAVIEWGKTASEEAEHLFAALREFDRLGMDFILCEPAENSDLGISVRNRLYKAAGYEIVRVGERHG